MTDPAAIPASAGTAKPREPCWEIADRIKGLIKLQHGETRPKEVRRWEMLGIQSEIEELNRRLAVDFGRRHGWTVSRRPFMIRTLAQGGVHDRFAFAGGYDPDFCDHPYWYRAGRRAKAVVAHLYDAKDRHGEIMTWAAARGLQASFPDFPSWRHPDWTMLVLYEAAGR
jgi:hypothetical protein